LSADQIKEALARHGGCEGQSVAATLGLPSRHALHRLMKKLNIPD